MEKVMQRMEWRDGQLQPVDGKAFLMRILLAHLSGMTSAEFAEQEVRRMNCAYCRLGAPLNEEGTHQFFEITIPCEASQDETALQKEVKEMSRQILEPGGC